MKRTLILILALTFVCTCLFAAIPENEDGGNNNTFNGTSVITISDFGTFSGSVGPSGTDPRDFWAINPGSYGQIKIAITYNNAASTNFKFYASDNDSNIGEKIFEQAGNINYDVTLLSSKYYYIEIIGTSGVATRTYTMVITNNGDATLPVELSSFTAVMAASDMVTLNWVSESESNMIGYNVYRNTRDQLETAIRINPTTVTAMNTSNQTTYSYTDDYVAPGEYWYWLESAEMTGENEFHGPVVIKVGGENIIVAPGYEFKHRLVGAYPNPFNPSTSIQYEVAAATNVEIAIFNVKGQKVRTFNQAHNNKGTYSVNWNGLDESGKAVNSGVYFYTMTAENSSQTKKMLLMK